MEVGLAIKLLKKLYKYDDEIMIDWVDRFMFDNVSKKVWSNSVGTVEGGYASMIDMDYVQDVVNEANEEEQQKENEND